MSDTKKELDQEAGDKVLKRMLETPPKPRVKDSDTESIRSSDSRRPANQLRD